MRLAFVIQRYGPDVHGGSEYLCRMWAERLARRHHVEVITTCARDYLTWADFYPPGVEIINGVRVQRFAVDAPRNMDDFNAFSLTIFGQPHSEAQEIEWMRRQGPYSSALFAAIEQQRDDFDLFIFMTYLYCTTYFGMPPVRQKAVLVPTAHDEPPIHLDLFRQVFAMPRSFVFLTSTEQAMLQRFFDIAHIPSSEVSIGVDMLPPQPPLAAPPLPLLLYIGRIHTSKGCEALYDYVVRYRQERALPLHLVFAGRADISMPAHPDIRYTGFISETEKQDLLRQCSVVMIPSFFESLSIICLEAWAAARPVLVNGQCEVLREQVLRSNGGLFYSGYDEFAACLDLLLHDERLREQLGQQGRRFVEHWYNWTTIGQRLELALTHALHSIGGVAAA